MKKRFPKSITNIIICAFIILSVLGLVQITATQASAAPENPLTQRLEGSSFMLSANTSLAVSDDVLSQTPPHDFQPLDQHKSEIDNSEEPAKDEQHEQSGEDIPPTDEDPNDADPGSDAGDGNSPGEGENPDTSTDGDGDGIGFVSKVYFLTDMEDSAILEAEEYTFTISHTQLVKQEELTVDLTYARVNGQTIHFNNNTCTVQLTTGIANKIRIYVHYVRPDDQVLEVASKEYTLYVGSKPAEEDPFDGTTDYFALSGIEHGKTYRDSTLRFQFIVLDAAYEADLQAYETIVSVNKKELPQFIGSVELQDGSNIIEAVMTFKKPDGSVYRPAVKRYEVFFSEKDVIIDTNPANLYGITTVYEPVFVFDAHAYRGQTEVALSAFCNGVELPYAGGAYQAGFKLGHNTIKLVAYDDGQIAKTQEYNITYIDISQWLDTNIDGIGFPVNNPTLTFYARLKAPVDQIARLVVTYDGATIYPDAAGLYTVTLPVNHTKTIRLRAATTVSGAPIDSSHSYSRAVRYEKAYIPPGEENDPPPPTPEDPTWTTAPANLDGLTTKSSIMDLGICAKDYKGKRIYAQSSLGGITVKLNGQEIHYLFQSDSETTYPLTLVAGENTVQIIVMDAEGNYAYKTYTVTYEPTDGAIGKMTISIEATTVGLGCLIAPTEIDIHDRVNAVYYLAELLNDNGFTYSYDGSPESNFYLAHILKDGMTANYKIPDDLYEIINEKRTKTTYNPDSLGEHDFYVSSGWMFQINGVFANRSLSAYYPKDGDYLRIRFTLAGGADLGGGMDGETWGDW
ncbi:MAG: hypothetical protein ACOYJC_05935 [Christensenellales bacterium]|jgi:hypothetical protein